MAVDKKMIWAFWGLVALVMIGLVLMVVSGLRRSPKGASDRSVALTIPDGEAQPVADSKSAAMRGAVSLDKYFGELVPEEEPEREPVARSDGSAVERVFGAGERCPVKPGMTEEKRCPIRSGMEESGMTGLLPIWTMRLPRGWNMGFGLSGVCLCGMRS